MPLTVTEAEKEESARITEKVKAEEKNNGTSDIGKILQRRVVVELSEPSSDEDDDSVDFNLTDGTLPK